MMTTVVQTQSRVRHYLADAMRTTPAIREEARECHAGHNQNWLIRVRSSALVTGFVLADGTHQEEEIHMRRVSFRPISCDIVLYL